MYKKSEYWQRGKILLNNRMFPKRRKIATLLVYATDLCDSRCQHCLIWKKRPVQYLKKENILGMMESRCVTKHTTVVLEGGEFLLHPDAQEIIKWYHTYHKKFQVLSNCLKPDRLIETMKAMPPERLFISLDGTSDTYKTMRGKDGYENVIRVIESLHKSLPISVMFCVSPWNTMDDLKHVAEVCKRFGVDLRVGIYSNITLFDTTEKAYQEREDFLPPDAIREFAENYDYLVLYNEWHKGNLKMSCNSILDSCIVFPNGDVPVCMNLDVTIGNIYQNTLDEIYAKAETVNTLKHYQHNCNACFINFHRKYDIILYRTFEKYFPKSVVSKMFGYHQWTADSRAKYAQIVK